jgi:diguanylate cyclase (GGDEF)-like protein
VTWAGERLAAGEASGRFEALPAGRRFPPELEAEFRAANLEQNVPRARYSTAIYLLFVLAVTAMNMLGGLAPMPDDPLQTIFLLRLGVACPALVLILCALDMAPLRKRYQLVVGTAVVALGASVMAISATAAASGSPQFQMGDVLVIVYACLFVGLEYRSVITVASLLVGAFLILGVTFGVAAMDLTFAGLVIIVTALMAVLSAGRVERLQRTRFIEQRKLNELAERDGLTGLYNRRKFDSLASSLWQQAYRDQRLLQVVLVDIDCFKIYNDLYGHQAGDECIRRISRAMSRAARRPLDFCARYGGEEFVLVLYGPTEITNTIPERIRAEIMEEQIPHQGSTVATVVTVSVGSATGDPASGRSLAGVILQADEALYTAKRLGRNRVVDSGLVEAGVDTGNFALRSVG